MAGAGGTINAAPASEAGDVPSYRITTGRRSVVAVLMDRARQIWPTKIAPELALRAGVSVRTAEAWLAGDRGIGGEPLAALLASDQGVAFLDAIMAAKGPAAERRWAKQLEKAALRAELRRQEDDLEARRKAFGL